MGQPRVFINRCMDKENLNCAFSGALLNPQTEGSSCTWGSMDELESIILREMSQGKDMCHMCI